MLKGWNTLERATKKGFDIVTSKAGKLDTTRDTDVQFYETLSPEAFDVIAATYGPDNLVQYIEAMEAAKMKEKKNAQPATSS